MNRIELHRGDSLEWMKRQEDESFDAMITDPPYCSGSLSSAGRSASPLSKYVQGGQTHQWTEFAGDTRDVLGMALWCLGWMSEAYRLLRPGGYALVFTDWKMLPVLATALDASSLTWRGTTVWKKTSGRPKYNGRYCGDTEFVLWATKGRMDKIGDPNCLGRVPSHVVAGVERIGVKQHLTGKPLSLMSELVSCVPAGGRVLDPFMGSGTTAIACLERGLNFAGCELVPEIFETARERIVQATKKAPGVYQEPAFQSSDQRQAICCHSPSHRS